MVLKLLKINHTIWDAMDTVNLIINLDNGKYKKHGDILSEHIIKEEIDGSCLKHINRND